MTPRAISVELDSAREHFHLKERCIFCDMLEQELAARERVVTLDEHFAVLAPYASRFPFELMILPAPPQPCLHRGVAADARGAGARRSRRRWRGLKSVLRDPPYNFVMHSGPNTETLVRRRHYWDTLPFDFHWHIEILPRLTRVAGFEWGTGLLHQPDRPRRGGGVPARRGHLRDSPVSVDESQPARLTVGRGQSRSAFHSTNEGRNATWTGGPRSTRSFPARAEDFLRLERRLARRVAQLSIIREIGECLQSAMSPERILRTILVGATASMGLRFNRAFLLLVDEHHGMLRGRDAIGPADADEAQRIWSRLSATGKTLRDLVDGYDPEGSEQRAARPRDRPAALGEAGRRHRVRRPGAPGAKGRRGWSRVPEAAPRRAVLEVLGVDTFVAVPLTTDGKPVGLLLADNAITRRAITDEDVDILELLGLQAAQALSRARLTEELARQVASLEAATRELRGEPGAHGPLGAAVGDRRDGGPVAHEIRNPLVAIGGFARSLLLPSPAEKDVATRESLEIIVNEVRRLESIVREVLEYSRPAPPKIGSVSLQRLAEEALDLLGWELDHAGVARRVEEAPETPPAAADSDQIFHAVVNLLRNAVQAMPQGGELDRPLARRAARRRDGDRGHRRAACPPEVLAHVLEPFFTTKPTGSGLGLTIASQIVARSPAARSGSKVARGGGHDGHAAASRREGG